MATVAQLLGQAVEHRRAGHLEQAAQAYRRILEAEPEQPDAWHLLGLTVYQAGRHAGVRQRLA